MSNLVEQFFNRPVPAQLWHYTSRAGFEGILSSNRIWATDARHTTDPSEFVHARDVAFALLETVSTPDDGMVRAKQAGLATVIHAFGDGILSSGKIEVFVASFSSAANLKSQWMGYGDSGRGVGIILDLSYIRPPQDIGSAVTFAPCVYDQEQKDKLIEVALNHYMQTVAQLFRYTGDQISIANAVQEWMKRHPGDAFDRAAFEADMNSRLRDQLEGAMAKTSFDLLRLASHFKNSSFQSESEWRLSLPHLKGHSFGGNEILHRGSQEIPYIAHNLFRHKLPITAVVAGPLCSDSSHVQDVVNKRGYGIPVTNSALSLGETVAGPSS